MSAAEDSETTATYQTRLLRLTRKRLERFVALLPRVMVNDEPEIIHDLRVWSRRLQQALQVVLPTPRPPKTKKVIRTLRRVRQALGPCRNLDVNIELIKDKRKHSSAAVVQRAWDTIESDLAGKRDPLLERARRNVGQHEVFAFIERTAAVIDTADHNANPIEKLDQAMIESMKAWEEAFASAFEQRDEVHLHQFRIATKRLRYRTELLADLGQNKAKPVLEELKKLQQALGDWHDRCVLLRHIADFIGQPDFLVDHPDLGRALLAEMEKEKLRNDSAIDELMGGAAKVRESWAHWKLVRDEIVEQSAEP